MLLWDSYLSEYSFTSYNNLKMSKISKEQVAEIALLARLEFSDQDILKYQDKLSSILSYVDTIQKVDTKKIEPTAQITGLIDVTREDIKKPSDLTRDEILSNTPDKKDGYIKVKAVLE
jgi:aspartyl-tRNA(Asn)/glutamyl-tRNA(Gln) amidotransferase subunit C